MSSSPNASWPIALAGGLIRSDFRRRYWAVTGPSIDQHPQHHRTAAALQDPALSTITGPL
jgi:hypothetical protein